MEPRKIQYQRHNLDAYSDKENGTTVGGIYADDEDPVIAITGPFFEHGQQPYIVVFYWR